jgi:Domain of unknown function (DUF5348)
MRITGTLRKNSNDRWEIVDDQDKNRTLELSSGSVCEVQIAGHWIRTRIEFAHGSGGGDYYVRALERLGLRSPDPRRALDQDADRGGDYYAVERGVLLCEGLPARIDR